MTESDVLTVTKCVATFDLYDLDGCTLEEAKELFHRLAESYSGRNIKLNYDSGGGEDYPQLCLDETRPETMEERQRRETFKEYQLAQKRLLLANLKKELGET